MPIIKESVNKEIPQNNTTLNSPQGESSASAQQKKGLINTIGALLPFAPVLFEQWTGQKIPPMTGTLAEMNTTLSQLSLALTQVMNNQQQLYTRLETLEKNASSQLTNLGQQFQSLRLTHTREKREIEYNQSQLED